MTTWLEVEAMAPAEDPIPKPRALVDNGNSSVMYTKKMVKYIETQNLEQNMLTISKFPSRQ